jgi:PBP1b-binding outer membrane lipoprotein LpoB
MSDKKNVKGIVLSNLLWNGLILKPKTEFDFNITKEQYEKLNNGIVQFIEPFDSVAISKKQESIEEDIALEKVKEEIIEDNIKDEIVEMEIVEQTKDEDEIVEELLSKREEIEEIKEKEREIAYERKQVNKARPIPASLKKRAIKK